MIASLVVAALSVVARLWPLVVVGGALGAACLAASGAAYVLATVGPLAYSPEREARHGRAPDPLAPTMPRRSLVPVMDPTRRREPAPAGSVR